MDNIYPRINYQQPLQQFYNNTFNSFATYQIEQNMRQTIEQDMLREYDFILREAHWLLNEINSNQFNSFNKDSKNVYLTLNGNSLINPIEEPEPIERELAHVLSREVHIVIDTKSLVSKRRENPQKIYLPLFLIPSKIEPTLVFDPYDQVKDSLLYFNLFTYNNLLLQRLSPTQKTNKNDIEKLYEYAFQKIPLNNKNNAIELCNLYFIKLFLSTLTVNNNSEYIEEWLTYFFKTLRRVRNNLVLIGNRDVSEEIFYNGIIQQVFGHDYCLTITDDILQNWSVGSIIENKLFLHINNIPEKLEHQKKLKELLESIIIHDVIKDSNGDIPFLCQIIITLDQPHPFLNDFLSHSKVFFINSLEKISKKLNQPDRISVLNNISNNLQNFSQQLASLDLSELKSYSDKYKYIELVPQDVINERAIHHSNKFTINDTVKFQSKEYKTDNELYKNWLKNPELLELALSFNSNKPVLDPFSDSFTKIIPNEDRHKHTYVTGKTGSGKSELLKTLIYRDILRDDCSVILLDIHGDLADSVTRLVEDKERLVLIDPILEKDLSPTINLFHTDDKSEENVEQVSQMITTIINEINVGDSPSGTMIDILENCIPLLVRSNDKDFYDLKRLMNDVPKLTGSENVRAEIQQKRTKIKSEINKFSKNEFEEEYFQDEFMDVNNSTRQAVKRRLNKMLKDSLFSNLTNGQNKINLRKEMNSSKNKIIIFNIPKSKMLNTHKHYIKFIIGLIQIIALKRADIKDEKKRPHTHLYIDEFHNFITPRIEEILTESRKYKLFLTLAHQSVSQIKDTNLRDIILDNTNVKIVGKNSNKTLEAMNKTLNTKLEDVQKLTAGEFYLQSGNNDVMKIHNSKKLLDGKGRISDEQWEEYKEYQIEKYYRSTKKEEILEVRQEEQKLSFEKMFDEFITTIIAKDLSETSCLRRIELVDPDRFKEIKGDFEYKKDNVKQPRIRQQELNIIFRLAFEQDDELKNDTFTKRFNQDDMFTKAQMMPRDEKYRVKDKSQEKYYIILS